VSLAGKALANGVWALDIRDIRDHGIDRHRHVDDTPAGGGPGMVMRADVLAEAIDAASPPGDARPRLLMSPRGRPLTQVLVRDFARQPGLVIVCGRFEGGCRRACCRAANPPRSRPARRLGKEASGARCSLLGDPPAPVRAVTGQSPAGATNSPSTSPPPTAPTSLRGPDSPSNPNVSCMDGPQPRSSYPPRKPSSTFTVLRPMASMA
jgi:hypothetical protein